MKRKEEKRRKKRIKKLIFFSGALLIGSVLLVLYFLYPFFQNSISSQKSVKSAFVTAVSVENVKAELLDKKIPYTKVEYADVGETYKVTLKGEEVVKLSGSKDIKAQVSTLQKLLRKLTIDNRQAKQIDLRYAKPVVKF